VVFVSFAGWLNLGLSSPQIYFFCHFCKLTVTAASREDFKNLKKKKCTSHALLWALFHDGAALRSLLHVIMVIFSFFFSSKYNRFLSLIWHGKKALNYLFVKFQCDATSSVLPDFTGV